MILDLSQKEHVPLIHRYKKCKGIALVKKYLPQLNPVNKMYVIDSIEDWEKVESEFPLEMMTVRCDSLQGVNGKLPNGQTFNRDRVREYIRQVKDSAPDGVIILEDMKPGSNERIHTQGGVTLTINMGGQVHIDYVGPGFDARELTLGKAVHQSWSTTWEKVPFMKASTMSEYQNMIIEQDAYIETAKERIRFLIQAFPDKKEEIFSSMPKDFKGIKDQLLRDVIEQLIFPLWLQKEQLAKDGLRSFGIEANIVEDGSIIPFEIQTMDRFKDFDRKINER